MKTPVVSGFFVPGDEAPKIVNGTPTRGSHLATIDKHSMWLANATYPMTPALFTCNNWDVHSTNTYKGLHTTDSSFSDYITIPMLVPAFCNFIYWGALTTGEGQIAGGKYFNDAILDCGPSDESDNQFHQGEADNMHPTWCKPTTTSDTDVNKPLRTFTGGVTGYKIMRRINFSFKFKRTGSAEGFAIHAFYFDYHLIAEGTNLDSFESSDGSNPV